MQNAVILPLAKSELKTKQKQKGKVYFLKLIKNVIVSKLAFAHIISLGPE